MKVKSKITIGVSILISIVIFIILLNIKLDKLIDIQNINKEFLLEASIIGVFFIKFLIVEKLVKKIERLDKINEFHKGISKIIIFAMALAPIESDINIQQVAIITVFLEFIMTIFFIRNVIKTKKMLARL